MKLIKIMSNHAYFFKAAMTKHGIIEVEMWKYYVMGWRNSCLFFL